MEEIIENIRNWLTNEAKNENCYYKLYTIKYPSARPTDRDLRAQNFHSKNIDESIEKITNDINIHGRLAKEYFVITHVSCKQDKAGVNLLVNNPLFQNQSNVNGFGSSNDNSLELMRMHYENSQNLKEEIQNLRHEHAMEKLYDRIDQIESANKTFLDTISGFIQSDVGKQIVNGVTQIISLKIKNNTPQTNNSLPQQTQQEVIKNDMPEAEHNANNDQQDNANSLVESLQKLDQVFGEREGINALEKLSQYCINNPEMAKSILNNIANERANNI
jgi:hypothetical protein